MPAIWATAKTFPFFILSWATSSYTRGSSTTVALAVAERSVSFLFPTSTIVQSPFWFTCVKTPPDSDTELVEFEIEEVEEEKKFFSEFELATS